MTWVVEEKRKDMKNPVQFGPFNDFMTALSFIADSAEAFKTFNDQMNGYESVSIKKV